MSTRVLFPSVVFLNEGSEKVGMGHIVRDLTLARVFLAKGSRVTFLSMSSETALSNINKLIITQGIDIDVRRINNGAQAWLCLEKINPDLLIIDGPESLTKEIHPYIHKVKYSLALDYFSLETPLPKMIVNIVDHASSDDQHCFEKLRKDVEYYEGHEYAIIRDEFSLARESYLSQHRFNSIERILISFGGADPSGNTFNALEFIRQNMPEVEVAVITGPLMQENYPLDFTSWQHWLNMSVIHHSQTIAEEMIESDLIFCGAGTTLLEAMCVGLPALVIPQTPHEEIHAERVAAKGGCLLFNDAVPESMQLVNVSTMARKLVDGQGKWRIFQQLSDVCAHAEPT